MFNLPLLTGRAPLRNREPAASGAFVNVVDERLHIEASSALDFSAWRATATPAGSRGRVTVSAGKLHENGVPVRFSVATMQPEPTFTPIPSDRAVIDAAVQYLARCGFNAIRVMGIEHWLMSGMDGAVAFNSSRVDDFDYFLAACKRAGLYWVLCPQSYSLYLDEDGAISRFHYQEGDGQGHYSCKPRMYTEQDIRDNWAAGTRWLYDRVNPYTGQRILQDPALLLLELYNEADTTFCAATGFPAAWRTRYTSNAAAKTWGEWLADPAQSHGYADLAALNTAWGTSHASFAAAAAASGTALTNGMALTVPNVDAVHYALYLETHLSAWYDATLTAWGYTGLRSQHMLYIQNWSAALHQRLPANNSVANYHGYINLAYGVTPGVATTDADNPIWEAERVAMFTATGSGPSLPIWLGEMGQHSYARWRHQFPVVAAAAASQGAAGLSFFTQGDFFYPAYYDDDTGHGDRFRRMDNFPSPGAFVNDFTRAAYNAVFLRGDVTELPTAQELVLNDRHYGVTPKVGGRITRAYSALLAPLQALGYLTKLRLAWTADTTDDTLAVTWNTKSLKTLCDDMQTLGAIESDHPMRVSATANNGNIASVATTGTVGGLVASVTQPVMDIGSNTLVDGDLIHITNLTGSVGTWPGINARNGRCAVRKGSGTYVRLEADATRNVGGLDLTGLSGANFTAGTWCESSNVVESGHSQWGWSRRLKRAFVSTGKTVFFAHTNATLPATVGSVIVSALTQNASVLVTSLDGNSIATSARLLVGMCGEAINTGMTYTVGADGKQTLTATGDYPVQQLDITASLSLALTRPQEFKLYRLQRNGLRGSQETPSQIDAAGGRLWVALRTGSISPAVFWELVRA